MSVEPDLVFVSDASLDEGRVRLVPKVGGAADRYAEMVRFRNFIVHRYEQIEPDIVYGLARHKLDRFRDFIDEIRKACADA